MKARRCIIEMEVTADGKIRSATVELDLSRVTSPAEKLAAQELGLVTTGTGLPAWRAVYVDKFGGQEASLEELLRDAEAKTKEFKSKVKELEPFCERLRRYDELMGIAEEREKRRMLCYSR